MAEYQAEMLYAVAGKLQGQMHRIIFRYVMSYMFLGAVVGLGLWMFGSRLLGPFFHKAAWFQSFPWWTVIPAVAVLLGFEGYSQGKRKSINLRFEAQRTLCWVKIEEHLGQLVEILSTEKSGTTPSKGKK